MSYLKSGRLVALGVSSPKRSQALPDVPAIGEKVPGYSGTLWVGLFAPRGVPATVETQLLRQPRHERDALRRRARPGPGHALRAGPARERRDRHGRRLLRASPASRPARCCIAGRASPTASPTCTTPAARAAASSTSSATRRPTTAPRRAADRRHRGLGAHASRPGCAPPPRPATSGAMRPSPCRRRATAAGADRDADPAVRRLVGRGRRGRRAAARARRRPPIDAQRRRRAPRALLRGMARRSLLLLGGARGARARRRRSPGGSPPRPARRLMAEFVNARVARGRGRLPIERVPYDIDRRSQALGAVRAHRSSSNARPPVGFFAYPGQARRCHYPPDAQLHVLSRSTRTPAAALQALVDELGAPGCRDPRSRARARRRPRRADARRAGADGGRADARGRDRLRRERLLRPRLLPRHPRRAAARLAASRRRRDRRRPAGGDRRGDRRAAASAA